MYNHNANFTHCCQVCLSLLKKKKMIFMKCTSKKSNGGSVSFDFLTSVHERRSIKIDITSKLYIRAG